jgi:hypothetical protein
VSARNGHWPFCGEARRRDVDIDAAPARMQQRPAIPGRNTKTGIRSDATEEGVNMDTHPSGNTHR